MARKNMARKVEPKKRGGEDVGKKRSQKDVDPRSDESPLNGGGKSKGPRPRYEGKEPAGEHQPRGQSASGEQARNPSGRRASLFRRAKGRMKEGGEQKEDRPAEGKKGSSWEQGGKYIRKRKSGARPMC